MLLQIEVKPKMLGRSVTFEPRSVEKHFQQQNFFELTTPNVKEFKKPPKETGVKSDCAFCLGPPIKKTNSATHHKMMQRCSKAKALKS